MNIFLCTYLCLNSASHLGEELTVIYTLLFLSKAKPHIIAFGRKKRANNYFP